MTKYIALLFVGTLLPLAVARSQVTDSTIALPSITVTATRIPMSIKEAPVRTHILDRHLLEESAAPTVASLLGSHTTLYVRSYGGVLSSLSLRGSTASQVLILLDGTPVMNPMVGQLDLSLLPLSPINSIEITSGSSSTLYGSNAVGGVVNLITTSTLPTLELRAGMGSWGHRTASLYAAGTRGNISGMISTDMFQSTGDFRYQNQGISPKRLMSRIGADQKRQSILGALTWETTSGKTRFSGFYNNAERGIPTIHAAMADSARQWDRSMRLWAEREQNWAWGHLQVKSHIEDAKIRYRNPRWSLDNTGRYLDISTDVSIRFIHIPNGQLITGLTGGYTRVHDPNLKDGLGEYKVAAYVSSAHTWNEVTVYPSMRLDGYQKDQALWAFTPRVGINVPVRFTPNLHLKGSAGRAFQVPTFNDRFYQPGGKPSLRPERGWSIDAGIIWASRMIEAELTVFSLYMTDQIVWKPVKGQSYWSPDNILQVTNHGLETSVKLERRLRPNLRIHGAALWTFTSSKGTGQIRLVPRHQIKTFTNIQWHSLAFQIGARYSGTQLMTDASRENGVRKLPSIFLVTGQLRLHLHPVTVRLQLENLTDIQYEYVPGHPMHPRSVRIDVGFTLR